MQSEQQTVVNVSFTTGTVLLLIPADFSIRSSSGGHGRREPD